MDKYEEPSRGVELSLSDHKGPLRIVSESDSQEIAACDKEMRLSGVLRRKVAPPVTSLFVALQVRDDGDVNVAWEENDCLVTVCVFQCRSFYVSLRLVIVRFDMARRDEV